MKKIVFLLTLVLVGPLLLSACQAEPEVLEVEVTRVVTETEVVTEQVEVTRIVEGEVVVEEVEVTRIVEVPVEEAEEAASEDNEIVISGALPSVNVDPHKGGTSPWERWVIFSVHDTLVSTENYNPRGELVGRLATDWSASEDGLLWTFNLRDDIMWQDGYGQFTADDVVFTYERLLDPDRSASAGLVSDIIKEVRAVDDFTVEMELLVPNADFERQVLTSFTTGVILSRAALEDIGDENYGNQLVGTGPYQLVERVVGERTVLETSPDYWGDSPAVERFVFVDIPEESVRADALASGEIDIGSFRQPVTIDRLDGVDDLERHISFERPCVWTLYVDDNVVPDVRVRQAIAHAINKHELANTVMEYRIGPDVTSFYGPGLPGFEEIAGDSELYPYDPDRARELLEEAGIAPGELTLQFPTRADFLEFSEVIAGYLEVVGINTELSVLETALFSSARRSEGADYDIVPSNPGRGTINQFLAFVADESRASQYEATGLPERVAELYDLQAVEQDPERRLELIDELVTLLEEDLPWVVFGYCASPATIYHAFVDAPFDNWVDAFHLPLEYISVN